MSGDSTETVIPLSELRGEPPLVLKGEPLVVDIRVGTDGPLLMRLTVQSLEYISHLELKTRGRSVQDLEVRTRLANGTPWRSVEEIARYVEGDSTDPQRIALADGIRERRYR